jgi:hypothetical protein
MVAKITAPQNIKRGLNYNEQKVVQKKAECIYAANFLQEASLLSFKDKLSRFERLIALNKRASTNTVHISLNFAEGEHLDRSRKIEIATCYMQKIGFGQQPFLVYEHSDAGHPHIHIVSTNIKRDGKRISLHNLGKNESNRARQEIEKDFGLIKADNRKLGKDQLSSLTPVQKATYGRAPTKRAITTVLDAVLPAYKYASLPELNAILSLYNIVADRGSKDSFMFLKKGLVYRILNEKGNRIGVPIKSSAIYSQPTLSRLEERFQENKLAKQPYKNRLKASLDWILAKPPVSFEAFREALQKERIAVVQRQNEEGLIYGLTYIDYSTKTVFNGSEIGKEYSAKIVLEKCNATRPHLPVIRKQVDGGHQDLGKTECQNKSELMGHVPRLIEVLVTPLEQGHYLPQELKKTKKKKRKS